MVFERSTLLTIRNGIRTITGPRLSGHVVRPNVDTFWLLDCIELFTLHEGRRAEYTTALEIGIGNGLILKTLPFIFPNLTRLIGVDVNPDAVLCTAVNLQEYAVEDPTPVDRDGGQRGYALTIAGPYHGNRKVDVELWHVDAKDVAAGRFDMVIVNPPYVPLPKPTDDAAASWWAGTSLIEHAVCDRWLEPRGRLALSVSDEMAGSLVRLLAASNGLRVLRSRSTSVRFLVRDVLDDREHLEWLVAHGCLQPRDGRYYHTLRSFFLSPRNVHGGSHGRS